MSHYKDDPITEDILHRMPLDTKILNCAGCGLYMLADSQAPVRVVINDQPAKITGPYPKRMDGRPYCASCYHAIRQSRPTW